MMIGYADGLIEWDDWGQFLDSERAEGSLFVLRLLLEYVMKNWKLIRDQIVAKNSPFITREV